MILRDLFRPELFTNHRHHNNPLKLLSQDLKSDCEVEVFGSQFEALGNKVAVGQDGEKLSHQEEVERVLNVVHDESTKNRANHLQNSDDEGEIELIGLVRISEFIVEAR